MSLELPKRIFKEGEEPQVTQINNNCRIDYIIRKFTEWLPKELEAVKKRSTVHDESAESDEDYHTPKGSKNLGATSSRGKKRLPNHGIEKRKHKILSTGPKQAPFNEDMKPFVTQLFEQGFSGMEQRLQKQMAEKFEKMKTELEDSLKEPSVEVEPGESSPKKSSPNEPSPKKPSPKKPSPTKPSTSQPPLRRSTRGNKGKALQLTDSPLRTDGSPQSSLYNCSEESWIGFTGWVKKPKPLPLDPSILNLTIASRIVSPGKCLGNEVMFYCTNFLNLSFVKQLNFIVNIQEMDAFMFIWRVNTTLKRWALSRVAFMSAMFCLQIDAAYNKFFRNKKAYELPEFLLGYGRGELPSHGRTDQVWGVDVDRLYFPLFVTGNHWVGVCIKIIEKKVEVLDSGRAKNRQHMEKYAALIPRIVKAVAPPERQKQLLLASYSIVDVPMKMRLNKSCCDCGAYALKHLECHLLGIDLSLVDDEIIMGCRQKIGVELWEAAHDPIYAEAMTRYLPSPWEREESFELED
ncbi:unnamed protein product [Eruca vesicaria subsp. sativa]|uniref:Ubiquitin-like protease family profile domain-containing protein n=1 Tax=Eruca vesicaria subsp. sativa TaxID=29727 RepID=A0ABC8M3S3_ERUVS|nr:unnamed protein product [Eruca vesicaria subsp. sativa]